VTLQIDRLSLGAKATAIGFALGSVVNATAWVLLSFGIELYGPYYPPWRHLTFAAIDASIAWVAVHRREWLVFALVAFLADQVWEHGVEPITMLVMLAVVAAGWDRYRRSTRDSMTG
jgi:hypothetical protein